VACVVLAGAGAGAAGDVVDGFVTLAGSLEYWASLRIVRRSAIALFSSVCPASVSVFTCVATSAAAGPVSGAARIAASLVTMESA